MTMLEQRIRQQFYDASDLLVQSAQDLSRPLADSVEIILSTITSGGRVLFAGTGSAVADAAQAAARLCAGGERQRPGLAALALGADAAALTALTQTEGELSLGLARQVQALGSPGDVLVLFEGHAGPQEGRRLPSLEPLVDAAHACDMAVLLWSSGPSEVGDSEGALAPATGAAARLTDTDVHVPIRAERPMHRGTMARLAWQAVIEAIEIQLLGEPE